MRKHKLLKLTKYTFLAALLGWAGGVYAQEDVSVTLLPVRYAAVKGDVAKFQAITGMKAGFAAGIEELNVDKKVKDVHVTFEGSTIPKEFDNDGHLLITKDNVGFIQVDYKSLRKYYDGLGGYFPFNYSTGPQTYGIKDDLHKDDSWFSFRIGNKTPQEANLVFFYERLSKVGTEDSLTWASVYESISGSARYKKVAPSLVDLNETTNTIGMEEKIDAAGHVTIKGKQSYEFVDGSSRRVEQQFTFPGDGTAADSKIRVQSILPQTKLLTSSVRAERWSLNDQTFVSAGYIFAHSRDTEIETTREYSSNWVLTGYTFPENKNGYAVNEEDKNAWTAELMSSILPSLTFTTKFKAEVTSRKSSSEHDLDAATGALPGFAVTSTDSAKVENNIVRTGETVALQYNGLPKTSLYTNLDLEQERSWLVESRNNLTSPSSLIDFEDITNTPKFVETVGARFFPIKSVTLTTDYKYKTSDAKYNNLYNNVPTGENFFDRLEVNTNEVNGKVSWKPFKWLQNSAAVKLAQNVYHTMYVTQDWEKSQQSEKDFNYDITIQPLDPLMFNVGYSLQWLKASTPASSQPLTGTTVIYVPTFTGNVNSWMFTTSYAPKDNLSVFNTISYSRAKNAQNNEISNQVTNAAGGSSAALAYAIDDEWWDSTVGIDWSPRKDLKLGPHYAYYSFRSHQGIDAGNYSAHVIWLDLKLTF